MDSVTLTVLSGRTAICASNFSILNSLPFAESEHTKTSNARASHRAVLLRKRRMRRLALGRGSCRRIKADFWRFALGNGGYFEEFARLEPEHACKNIGGELLNLGVQVADDRVVVAARVLNGVFNLHKRILQGSETFNGAKLRIGLGQSEQALQGAREQILSLGLIDGPGCGHGAIASVDDGFESAFFMPGITLHCFDEIGNQVITTLELHVDVGPSVVHLNLKAHQAVVHPDQERNDQNQTNQQYPADHIDLTRMRKLGS